MGTRKADRKPILSLGKSDFRWDYYRGTGAGGQKRNKTSNCVRCTHPPSGSVGKSEEGRSQWDNKKKAFKRCVETKKFRAWMRVEVAKANGAEERMKEEVKRLMAPKNMHYEGWDAKKGKWVKIEGSKGKTLAECDIPEGQEHVRGEVDDEQED